MTCRIIELVITFLFGAFLGVNYGVWITHKLVGDAHYLVDEFKKLNTEFKASLSRISNKL